MVAGGVELVASRELVLSREQCCLRHVTKSQIIHFPLSYSMSLDVLSRQISPGLECSLRMVDGR